MRTRQQITLHLDPALVTALDAEAGKRGLTASRAANDLRRRALIEEGTEPLADTVKARLDRLDRRDGARARELAILKEAFFVFVRTWFLYAGAPVLEGEEEADAEARFEAFLGEVAEGVEG